ncbi:hypothetical protein [Fischerella sp. JS2]|uniref:hypothetical protein n=1 Tax=Fischerella sp. JS2 TaxID=2597771 RepID=UPI0028EDC732|nr:hypothetical protein [Fischerella sp. JS2]
MIQDEFNYSQDNPEDINHKTQLNLLNDLEECHYNKPDKEALVISVSLSVIEAVFAFSMIASAGIFIASIIALFPVALLWAISHKMESLQDVLSTRLKLLSNNSFAEEQVEAIIQKKLLTITYK